MSILNGYHEVLYALSDKSRKLSISDGALSLQSQITKQKPLFVVFVVNVDRSVATFTKTYNLQIAGLYACLGMDSQGECMPPELFGCFIYVWLNHVNNNCTLFVPKMYVVPMRV